MIVGGAKEKENVLGVKWIIGGDFNNIKDQGEKKGRKRKLESSFADFRNFISDKKIGDIKFRGEVYMR